MPEPFLMPTSDERLPGALFARIRVATPTEARLNKCVALSLNPDILDDRAHTIVRVPVGECKRVSRLYRDSLDLQHQHQLRLLDGEYQGEAPEEGDPIFLPGETGFFAREADQKIVMFYGDDTPCHAAHVNYRLHAYPRPSGKVAAHKIGRDSAPVTEVVAD